jgi:adenylate cyclase
MGTEIERKFLVRNEDWRGQGRPIRLAQGYLSRSNERVVRIRTADDEAFITVKGVPTGISRAEYEYSIPLEDAREMLSRLCIKPLIVKTRHVINHAGATWYVDEYQEPRADLIVAEIELSEVDEAFERPTWLGAEVSADPAYSNHNMLLQLGG